MSLDTDPTMQEAVVWNPRGTERGYRVEYETEEVAGHDTPFLVRVEFPNQSARYRVKVQVEQIPQEPTPP